MTSITKILDATSSLLVAVAALAVIYVLVLPPRSSTRPEAPSLSVGMNMDLASGLRLPSAQSAGVFVFVNSRCRYCTESMAFYRRLAALTDGRVPIHYIGVEPVPTLETYLRQNELDVSIELVHNIEPRAHAYLVSTPTLLVVDGRSRLVGGWRGLLDPAAESAVVSAVEKIKR